MNWIYVSSGWHNQPFEQLRSRWDKAIIMFDIFKHCLINGGKVKEMVVANQTLVYFCLLGNFANFQATGIWLQNSTLLFLSTFGSILNSEEFSSPLLILPSCFNL